MLDLFETDFDRDVLGQRLSRLAARGAWIGTSSWKYPGWLGALYDRSLYEHRGRYAQRRFEDLCLTEYSRYFRTVCVDAGYYRFPDAAYLDGLFGAVDPQFLFTFKVTETVTIRHYPKLPRYGDLAGSANAHFLDAELFSQEYLGPMAPYRDRTGLLVFEFSEFRSADFADAEEFLAALDEFLGALPAGWRYGVELRTESFLGATYFAVLRRHGVAHVYNQWTRMPPVEAQLTLPGSITAPFTGARFLLTPGRAYEEAVQQFSPYAEIRDVDPSARGGGGALVWDVAMRDGIPVFVYVNNRLEGNALWTVWAVTEAAGDR